MEPVVALQQAVWHLPDRDVVPPHELFTVAGTGGAVLGAWSAIDDRFLGFVFGWGGYVNGRPRLRSDMMAVQPDLRHRGLGFTLKALQGALAQERGFVEMVWTVDPLHAANARLNFAKLGAFSREYHCDLYGDFGAGLYGAMPTDALIVHWPLDSARVRERLLRPRKALTVADFAGLQRLETDEVPDGARVLVEMPADIDRLLNTDQPAALSWRQRLRVILRAAFERGYAITDFVSDRSGSEPRAFYVLDRTQP
jgi:predicted GNAT superfamily acetyltransferase